MSVDVDVPQPFQISPFHLTGGVGLSGGIDIGFDSDLNTINVDLGLDNVCVGINPEKNAVDLGLDDICIGIDPQKNALEVDLGLDDICIGINPNKNSLEVDLGLDDINACLSIGIKELPKMRVHFPTKYDFCFRVFGFDVFGFGLSGKSMIITEDNPTKMFSTIEHKQYPPPTYQNAYATQEESISVRIEEE